MASYPHKNPSQLTIPTAISRKGGSHASWRPAKAAGTGNGRLNGMMDDGSHSSRKLKVWKTEKFKFDQFLKRNILEGKWGFVYCYFSLVYSGDLSKIWKNMVGKTSHESISLEPKDSEAVEDTYHLKMYCFLSWCSTTMSVQRRVFEVLQATVFGVHHFEP